MSPIKGRHIGNVLEMLNKINNFVRSLPKRGNTTTLPRLRDLQIGTNRSSAYLMLQELVGLKYVNRIKDKDNNRSFLYELTSKGKNLREVLEEYQNGYITFSRQREEVGKV